MTGWSRPVAPWPLFVGLILLHVLAALGSWVLADLAQQDEYEANQVGAHIYLRVATVSLLLGLLAAWRARWGLWLASLLVVPGVIVLLYLLW